MRRFALVVLLLCTGCPNKAAAPTPDAGNGRDAGADAGSDAAGPTTDREISRSVPLAAVGENRLEDPMLSLQNDSWFAVTSNNEPLRVQRVFEPDAPNDGTIVGIPPSDNASSCLLGRMKWGPGTHLGAVWVDLAGADASQVVVDLVGLRLDAEPSWSSVELAMTDQTYEANGRSWIRWEVMSPERFGWGYFEVCSASAETVFITGPELLTVDTSNALTLQLEPPAASLAQVARIAQFDAWWKRRRQSEAPKSNRP